MTFIKPLIYCRDCTRVDNLRLEDLDTVLKDARRHANRVGHTVVVTEALPYRRRHIINPERLTLFERLTVR